MDGAYEHLSSTMRLLSIGSWRMEGEAPHRRAVYLPGQQQPALQLVPASAFESRRLRAHFAHFQLDQRLAAGAYENPPGSTMSRLLQISICFSGRQPWLKPQGGLEWFRATTHRSKSSELSCVQPFGVLKFMDSLGVRRND